MKSTLLFIAVLYFALGFLLYLGQRGFIYFPVRKNTDSLYTEVFENEGQQIKAAVLNLGNKKALLYFGGNAEDVDFNAASFAKLFYDHTVYLVKYRGYGGSSGTPSEAGIYSDAIHIHDVISARHDRISAMGRSLGSAVATYVAANRKVDKLVLITPFDSVQSVAQSMLPIYPMGIILKDRYDSVSRVNAISAQTLIVAAEKDRVIAMKHTRRLADAFASRAVMHVVKGADHNDISAYPDYYQVIQEFMQDHRLQRPARPLHDHDQ